MNTNDPQRKEFREWLLQQKMMGLVPRYVTEREMYQKFIETKNIFIKNDPNIIQITFNTNTGRKTIVNAHTSKTLEQLLKGYIFRLGLLEDVLGKDVMFLYNGVQLDPYSKSALGSMFSKTALITVYDFLDKD